MVELAICLPVLILLLFGTIEACAIIYLNQSLKIAAYEGARVSLIPTAFVFSTRQSATTCVLRINQDRISSQFDTFSLLETRCLGKMCHMRRVLQKPRG